MPYLEAEMAQLLGTTAFATLHVLQGCWQYPLADEVHESFKIITLKGLVFLVPHMHSKGSIEYNSTPRSYVSTRIRGAELHSVGE